MTDNAGDDKAPRLKALEMELLEIKRAQGEAQTQIWMIMSELTRVFESAVMAFRAMVVSSDKAVRFDGLTIRQMQVLRLVALGVANKEIGYRLGISVKTVEFHKTAAKRKLRLRSRAEIVRYVLDHERTGEDVQQKRPSLAQRLRH
jgi:DNA-binding CsgD family transcriptional regulator